jgi:hypothetical protein
MSGPNPDAVRIRRIFLGEHAALLENLSAALRLACERGSDEAAGVHLKEIREVLVEAIALYKQGSAE